MRCEFEDGERDEKIEKRRISLTLPNNEPTVHSYTFWEPSIYYLIKDR